jgi:hypothetical protein
MPEAQKEAKNPMCFECTHPWLRRKLASKGGVSGELLGKSLMDLIQNDDGHIYNTSKK